MASPESTAPAAPRRLPRGAIVAAGVGAALLVLAMELVARHYDVAGPTRGLVWDLVGGPKRGRVIWAALAITLVGIDRRRWARILGAAVAVDAAFVLARLPFDTRLTYGNGPFWIMLAIGVIAWTRWEEPERANALKALGLGLLLIVGSKMGDAWLAITVPARPLVLDQYVQTADHALGNPSWAVAQFLDWSGPVVQRVIQTVYIELPVAAMIVAVWQLRKGWPSHHIVRSFVLVALIGPVFYVLFPVVGPKFAFGPLGGDFALAGAPWPDVVPWNLHPRAFPFDDITPRNCMPSLHTAWTVMIFLHTRRQPWFIRAFGTFWTIGTLTATLGFGWHYGVDLVAGVVFALTVESLVRDPERGWDRTRWSLVIGGFVLHGAMLLSFRYLAVPMAEHRFLGAVLLLGSMAAMILAFHRAFFVRPLPDDADPLPDRDGAIGTLAAT